MKRTHEEIEEIVNDLGYKLLDKYMHKNYRRVIIQDNNGYKWDGDFNSFMNHGISFFDSTNPYTSENIVLWLKINSSEFILCKDNIYEKAAKKLKVFHNIPECQEEFYMSWDCISRKYGCPVCSGKQVGKYNSLAYLHPNLKEEWHPKNNLLPEDVTEFSNKKAYWICSECQYGKNKEWFSQIGDRSKGVGCPRCSDELKESKIASELKKWCLNRFGADNVDPEHKMFKNPKTEYWLRCDIYLGKTKTINGIYIEVHGLQHFVFSSRWHKTKEKFEYNKNLDKIKKKYAKKNGTYIEVDLRKIKTIEQAIEYVVSKIPQFTS